MSIRLKTPTRRAEDLKRISPGRKSLDAELYGLGHTLKHLQPPGGTEHGVFDAYKLPQEPWTPKRKVKDYLKSQIFDMGEPLSPRPITPAKESTHHHLFPETPAATAKSRHNHQKSTVFDPDPPQKAPAGLSKKNPITGESCRALDERRRLRARKVRNPITFEGVAERLIPSRCSQPPGGRCTLVLEYIE